MRVTKHLLIISLLLCLFFVHTKANTQYSFLRLNAKDGLVNNQVTCLFEDSNGFIWIGTSSGLSRYDGSRFVNYAHSHSDSTTISDNYIEKIQEDKNGLLWIETRWEISIYDPLTNTFNNDVRDYFRSKGILEQIDNIYIDNKKQTWYKSATRGKYFILDSISHQLVDPFTTGINTVIQNQLIHKNGLYYLLYENGLIEVYSDTDYHWIAKYDEMLKHFDGTDFPSELFVDNEGDLWVFGDNNGIYFFNSGLKQWEAFTVDSDESIKLSNNLVTRIIQDDKGLIWIGTDHGGIDIVNKYSRKVQTISYQKEDPNSISQNSITDLFIDSNNLIWIGTYKNGISYYHESIHKFPHYHNSGNPLNTIPYNDVNCFAEDKTGNLWIGTNGGGLIYYNRTNRTSKTYKHDPKDANSLSNDVIVALYVDEDNVLWIGTFTGGLNAFNGQRFKRYLVQKNNANSISNNNIWDIVEDEDNRLWIATLGGGVSLFDKVANRFIPIPDSGHIGLPSPFVNQIWKMNNGNLIFATALGVMFYDMEENRFRNHPMENRSEQLKISNNNVNAVYEDSRGWIWIATREGLTLFDPYNDYIKIFDEKTGLSNDIIDCILEDEFQSIWVSKSSGISQITAKPGDPSDGYDFDIQNFTQDDGLQNQEFNVNASLRTSDGELIFGGPNGFNMFKPKNIKFNKEIPRIVFTDLQIFNKSVGIGERINGKIVLKKSFTHSSEIELKHSMNVFSIEFAALSFFNPHKIKYKYMLDGFDQGWNETNNIVNKVTYTNLNGGHYVFKVMACNNDGYWTENPVELNIEILPPFYASNLAFVIYFLIIAGFLIYLRYSMLKKERFKLKMEHEKIMTKRHHEMDEMKLRFLTNVSHEFRTPLTLILTPLDKLLKVDRDPSERKLLETIKRNTNELLNLVNQLLDFRKLDLHGLKYTPSYGDIVAFLEEVCENFTDSFHKASIEFSFSSTLTQFFFSFDREKLRKVMMNLISNALKFTSSGGKVTVTLDHIGAIGERKGNIVIRVKDTGVGIEEKDHEKIFERFYQSSNSNALGFSGSGIGLNLAKEMIELHKGTITVESEPNVGSEFIVNLPIMEEEHIDEVISVDNLNGHEVEYQEDVKVSKRDKNKPVILLIEDNFDFRQFMRETLEDNYEVHEAADGKEGFDKVHKIIPDMIVSDVMMPRMDGLEMCRKLKQDVRTSHIPLILLTARTADEDKLKGLEIGADDYITKPFNMDLLLVRIDHLVKRQKNIQTQFQKNVDLSPSSIEVTPLDEKLIKKAINCVEKNISESKFTVEDLSRELGMSRVYLYKKLTAITGKSPVEFIRVIRLKRGAQLLEKSQMNISEIAYEVGFNSPRYFSKYFKEEYGMLPTQYVKAKSKEGAE